MTPLNIYLDRATPDEVEPAVLEYGNAIRELAVANIFPGDLLWRNFGVTRNGRVVFYDYDEIEYLTDVHLPPDPAAAEPGGRARRASRGTASRRNDVFPEEFATFLLGDPRLRETFLRHHAELLEPEFWQECQRRIEAGEIVDFFPYPESLRFCNREDPCADRLKPRQRDALASRLMPDVSGILPRSDVLIGLVLPLLRVEPRLHRP